MDWIPFLAAAVRLVDLHDSQHAIGVEPQAPPEVRPATSDGLWLDIAAQLMEYVQEQDIEANEGWIYLGPFFEQMMRRHRLPPRDVRYVVLQLTTPSELVSIAPDSTDTPHRVRRTKETALLERPAQHVVDRCRLTPVGRRALALAQAGQNWLYTHHDAEKIVTAINLGDFGDLTRHCGLVAHAVRGFAHEITRLLEQPGHDQLIQSFIEHNGRYLETIEKVQRAVGTAKQLLRTDQVQAQLAQWNEPRREPLAPLTLYRALDELMQSVERLARHFADFVAAVTGKPRDVVGTVRFDKAAMALAFGPAPQDLVHACITALGPWAAALAAPIATDFEGCLVTIGEEVAHEGIAFSDESDVREPTMMERFMLRYRAQICEALRQGPLSIMDAAQRGWVTLEGEDVLSQVIGVYAAPDWLGIPDAKICVGTLPGALDVAVAPGRYLRGDDLVMFVVEGSGPDAIR